MVNEGNRPFYSGADFLTRAVVVQEIFSPENFTAEHKMMVRAANDFFDKEVQPRIEQIETADPSIMRNLLEKAGEAGLLMAGVPECYGGMGTELKVNAILSAQLSRQASFFVAWSVQTGIGILPLVYFGSDTLKAKYLPDMVKGKLIGAFALTEAEAGSDAISIKTQAAFSPDHQHYVINGTKKWISNAGFADLFTVFAKTNDFQFTEFLMDAKAEGISLGPEEEKMGIKGSSNRPIVFNNVKIPSENILWEAGEGFRIVSSVMNIGRTKLAAGCAGWCREALNLAVKHACERKVFGQPIGTFGLIQKKLAYMVADTYAAECIAFRTAGMFDERLDALKQQGKTSEADIHAGIEEYTIEASIAKVFGSEACNRVIDEGLQIFGGYGFMDGCPISRAYRDARITRIFEGTNEIIRLLISSTLFKRIMLKQIPFLEMFPEIEKQINRGSYETASVVDMLDDAINILERTKQAFIYTTIKVISGATTIQQEILEYIADTVIAIYTIDSALARAISAIHSHNQANIHILAARLITWRSLSQIQANVGYILHAIFEGKELTSELQKLYNFIGTYHINTIEEQHSLAAIVIDREGYPLFDIK